MSHCGLEERVLPADVQFLGRDSFASCLIVANKNFIAEEFSFMLAIHRNNR